MTQQQLLEALAGQVGQEVHVSDWLEVTQERIDAFADATGDRNWIHLDVQRAARETPWRATIAHGYLTLSLYPMLRGMASGVPYPGVRHAINYGINKLRFPNVVRAGSRIRARSRLLKVEEIQGGLQVTEQYTAEVEGESKPACVAETLVRLYFA